MSDYTPSADCYSAGERAAMGWGQHARAVALGPLIKALAAAGVTADAITLLSLLAGLAFVPLAIYAPTWALLSLAVHVLLDGLDGPLARHLGTASRRGSFTDTTCDQLVVAATTLTLVELGKVSVAAGGAYVFIYTLVVAFAMVRNALGVPYSWVIRPRFVVYAALAFEFLGVISSPALEVVVWICNAVLLLKLVTGFISIRQQL